MDYSFVIYKDVALSSIYGSLLGSGRTVLSQDDLFTYMNESCPELKATSLWNKHELELLIEKLIAEQKVQAIESDGVAGVALTTTGRKFAVEYLTSQKPINETDIELLNAALPLINTYGNTWIDKVFTQLINVHKRGDTYAVKDYLVRSGFAKKVTINHITYVMEYIELTDRGRKLVAAGSLKSHFEKELEEEKKGQERIERTNDLLKYQKENAEWQKKYGNPLLLSNRRLAWISIGVAVSNAVLAASIAIYVAKMKAPPVNKIENKIVVDSLFLRNNPVNQKGTDSDTNHGQDNR